MRIKALDASCLPLCTFAECPFVCCPPLIFAVYLDHLIHMFYVRAQWHVFPEEKYVWHGLSLSLVDRPLKFPHEQRGVEKKSNTRTEERHISTQKPLGHKITFSCSLALTPHQIHRKQLATATGLLKLQRVHICPFTQVANSLAHSCTRFPCYLGMKINAKTQWTTTKIVELGN